MNFLSIFKRNLIFKIKKKIDIDKHIFDSNMTIEELFSFYETDKAKFIKNQNVPGHGYSDFYEKHFYKFKNKSLNILEIGSYSGASAAAFSKYFPNSNIYCLDVNLSKFIYKSKQIFPHGLDVTNSKMLKKFQNKIDFEKKIISWDIIIDDGSHILSHQHKSINYFFRYLKLGGLYVIEDYKFPEYFMHLKDIDDFTLSKIVQKIKDKQSFKLKFINDETLNSLRRNIQNIFEYKGIKKISDILFIEKLD